MNREKFIERLSNQADLTKEKAILVNDILENNFFISKRYKDKIISEKPIVPYLSMIAKNCVKNKFRHNSKRDCLFLKDNFLDKDFFEKPREKFE